MHPEVSESEPLEVSETEPLTAAQLSAENAQLKKALTQANASAAQANASAAQAIEEGKKKSGTYCLNLNQLILEIRPIQSRKNHRRPQFWSDAISKIPPGSQPLDIKDCKRIAIPAAIEKINTCMFGRPMKCTSGVTNFPVAHVTSQGPTCRILMLNAYRYLIGVDFNNSLLDDTTLKCVVFGYNTQEAWEKKRAGVPFRATREHCPIDGRNNLVRLKDQYTTWDQRNAVIFIPKLNFSDQLQWNGDDYSAYVIALDPDDYHSIKIDGTPLVEELDLNDGDQKQSFGEALDAAAEGQIAFLSGVLSQAGHPNPDAPTEEPFASQEKTYVATLAALERTKEIAVLTARNLPANSKVYCVSFSARTGFLPHPAFLTLKGANVVVNLNKLKGFLAPDVSPDVEQAAIAFPGCLLLEGESTSCAICRAQFLENEYGIYQNADEEEFRKRERLEVKWEHEKDLRMGEEPYLTESTKSTNHEVWYEAKTRNFSKSTYGYTSLNRRKILPMGGHISTAQRSRCDSSGTGFYSLNLRAPIFSKQPRAKVDLKVNPNNHERKLILKSTANTAAKGYSGSNINDRSGPKCKILFDEYRHPFLARSLTEEQAQASFGEMDVNQSDGVDFEDFKNYLLRNGDRLVDIVQHDVTG